MGKRGRYSDGAKLSAAGRAALERNCAVRGGYLEPCEGDEVPDGQGCCFGRVRNQKSRAESPAGWVPFSSVQAAIAQAAAPFRRALDAQGLAHSVQFAAGTPANALALAPGAGPPAILVSNSWRDFLTEEQCDRLQEVVPAVETAQCWVRMPSPTDPMLLKV